MTGTPTDELPDPPDRGSNSSPVSSDSTPNESELVREPSRLDRYVLLERIGRGSFASVWAAYDPQLDRRVAIKLLPHRRNESDASATQLAEAQALARLSHPNVVAVHDVQSYTMSGSGTGVFIVMEFLAGASLSEWMADPHDWREVVAVFVEAGRGLAAAHERGLVHRDFKPSNVMFGADGRVRVLDFGLARPTVSEPEVDRKHRIAGTPAYMAPEQHLGEHVDARSDQFAFCVALYEALYGERPFVGNDRIAVGKAKLRGDVRPPPRTTVPAWLHAIVLRGLAVERDARFPDMTTLLDVLSHDPGLVRRRWAVAISLATLLVGSAYGLARLEAGSGPQNPCESPERELHGVWDDAVRADIQRSFAATQLSYADAAYQRIERALDTHTQEWARLHREVCEATMVRNEQSVELMAEQMLCLQRRLRRIGGLTSTLAQADPASLARAGDVVLTLDSPSSCRERVAAKRSDQLDPALRSDALALEGEITRADVLTQLARYEEAVTVAKQAIDQALALSDADGAGRAWLAQTRALWYLGRYDDAINASEEAMRWAAKVGDDETLAMAQIRLIRTYTSMGKYEVAEAVAKLVAVVIEDGRLGRELEAWYDLYVAILYSRQSRWQEAQERLDHGLALREQLYGPEHPELAAFHNTYGNVLLKQRKFDDALTHYHEALRLWESNFGPEYPDIASVNNNIGAIYLDSERYDEAHQYFERVLASYELSLGTDNPQIIPTLANLANAADGQGRRRDGLALFERARGIAVAKLGADNLTTARIDFQIALILYELGEIERAELLVARALEIQRRDGPEDLSTIVDSASLLAACQLQRGDFESWQETLERMLEQLDESKLEVRHVGTALLLQAQLAHRRGADQEALALAEQYVAALEGMTGTDIARRLPYVVELLIDAGEFEAAATRSRDALARSRMAPDDRARWELEYLLGRAEAGRGDRAAAIAALQRALEFCSGPDGNPRRAKLVREQLDALQE